jgi:hypothetical protein
MVSPVGFLKLVEHISGRFGAERQMRLGTRAVCPRGAAASACSAAIAALVNGGFLQWVDEHELMRGDADCKPPTRRTA